MQFCKTKLAAAVLLLIASFLPALAQTNTTSLTGDVQDATGAAIAGSTVTLTNPETGLTQAAQSGSAGQYSFNQIPPGKYTVKVSSPGFSQQVQKIELLVATPARITFKLSAGTSEVVSVETSIAAINSDDGTLGKAFNSSQVSSLPYLANNVTYLLSLRRAVIKFFAGFKVALNASSGEEGCFVNGSEELRERVFSRNVRDQHNLGRLTYRIPTIAPPVANSDRNVASADSTPHQGNSHSRSLGRIRLALAPVCFGRIRLALAPVCFFVNSSSKIIPR
jgi:hypothetical protein